MSNNATTKRAFPKWRDLFVGLTIVVGTILWGWILGFQPVSFFVNNLVRFTGWTLLNHLLWFVPVSIFWFGIYLTFGFWKVEIRHSNPNDIWINPSIGRLTLVFFSTVGSAILWYVYFVMA